jgi:predicted ester cyclase
VAKAGTTEERNKAVVLRYVEEVWNEHDLDAIDGLVSPDYLNHAARTAEYQRGGARRAVQWLLSVFPDHRFEVEDAAADGETVALRGTMAGTHEGELEGIAPTGKRVVAQQSHWFRVVDGKVGRALGGQGRPLYAAAAGAHARPGAAGGDRPYVGQPLFSRVRGRTILRSSQARSSRKYV